MNSMTNMNTKIYILFETDQWLTKSNSTILAVCTSKEKAFDLFEEIAKNRTDISIDDIIYAIDQMIESMQATLLLDGYYIEEYQINELMF